VIVSRHESHFESFCMKSSGNNLLTESDSKKLMGVEALTMRVITGVRDGKCRPRRLSRAFTILWASETG
jgi:hypothetical protein